MENDGDGDKVAEHGIRRGDEKVDQEQGTEAFVQVLHQVEEKEAILDQSLQRSVVMCLHRTLTHLLNVIIHFLIINSWFYLPLSTRPWLIKDRG